MSCTQEYIINDTIQKKEETDKSKYTFIAADSLLNVVPDSVFSESNSFLFDKAGRLIKHIRFVDHDGFYVENIENFLFSQKGRLLEYNSTDFDKALKRLVTFQYDSNGRLVKSNDIDFRTGSNTEFHVIYKGGSIEVEQKTTRRDSSVYLNQTLYDNHGQLVENSAYVKTEYDKNGNILSHKYLGPDTNSILWTTTFEYDINNQKIKETRYDSLGNLEATKMFYYDEKGELVQEIEIDSAVFEIKKYDQWMNVSEYSYVPFKERYYSFHHVWEKFDQYGNRIKHIIVEETEKGGIKERIETVNYDYDQTGNWVLKKVYWQDSLVRIVKREILYY